MYKDLNSHLKSTQLIAIDFKLGYQIISTIKVQVAAGLVIIYCALLALS